MHEEKVPGSSPCEWQPDAWTDMLFLHAIQRKACTCGSHDRASLSKKNKGGRYVLSNEITNNLQPVAIPKGLSQLPVRGRNRRGCSADSCSTSHATSGTSSGRSGTVGSAIMLSRGLVGSEAESITSLVRYFDNLSAWTTNVLPLGNFWTLKFSGPVCSVITKGP